MDPEQCGICLIRITSKTGGVQYIKCNKSSFSLANAKTSFDLLEFKACFGLVLIKCCELELIQWPQVIQLLFHNICYGSTWPWFRVNIFLDFKPALIQWFISCFFLSDMHLIFFQILTQEQDRKKKTRVYNYQPQAQECYLHKYVHKGVTNFQQLRMVLCTFMSLFLNKMILCFLNTLAKNVKNVAANHYQFQSLICCNPSKYLAKF